MKVKNDHRSKLSKIKQLERRRLQKLRLQRDSNQCPLQIKHRTSIREGHGFESHWSPESVMSLLHPREHGLVADAKRSVCSLHALKTSGTQGMSSADTKTTQTVEYSYYL